MSALNEILYRDEPLAQVQAKQGYNHTTYLFIIISHLLKKLGCEVKNRGNDPVTTGTHWGTFTDPVTGIDYEIRLSPLKDKIH